MALSFAVGIPALLIAIFGMSHGALMELASLVVVWVLAACVLVIWLFVGVTVLIAKPWRRSRANYMALAFAAVVSILFVVPAFFGR